MNVTCEKCQRRYVVPDEKLQERSLRLRCRNCQNVIEVALPPAPPTAAPAGGANPWDEEPTRAAPALDKNARWFAMVKGHQVGPLELPALQEKVRTGEVTLQSFLWRDGLDAWRRAEELPELLPVFAAPKVSAPVQPPPSPRPALHNLFDDEERTVLRPKKPRAEPAPKQPATSAQARASEIAPQARVSEGAPRARVSEDGAPPARVSEDAEADPTDDAEVPEPTGRGRWGWMAIAAVALVGIAAVAAVLFRAG